MPNLALFDFDGTITSDDAFTRFVFHAVPPLKLACGKVALAPLIAAYRAGMYPATRLRANMSWVGFRGRDAAALRAVGEAFARTVIPTFLRPEAVERLRWHKEQGDVIAVVSASLDVYLAPWCRDRGIELICTQLETRAGRITGRYLGGDCTAGEKARRAKERFDIGRYPVVYAYGDTHEDAELLALGTRRWFCWREIS